MCFKARQKPRAEILKPKHKIGTMKMIFYQMDIFFKNYNLVWTFTYEHFLFSPNYKKIHRFSSKRPNPCAHQR